MVEKYIPESGDIVMLTFDPQSGHEQKGRRPALILSDFEFNKKTGLVLVCPITSVDNGFPFHIKLPQNLKIKGYVMVEQAKTVDFYSRKVSFVEKIPDTILRKIKDIIHAIVD